MNEILIKAEELTKYYGAFPALRGASFEVFKGEIVGLLGPNGAGKTTLMQILTSITLPTSGNAWIGGHHIIEESLKSRRLIGYCSEKSPLYLDMTVFNHLNYVSDLKGVKKNRKEMLGKVIVECGLDSVSDKMIGKLSKGFRQRVSLAQALINEPSVLILDEPTIGLDPEQIRDTRDLIRKFRGDRSILISTHILYEAGLLCDRVIIIDHGHILAIDTPDNLDRSLGGFIYIDLIAKGPRDGSIGRSIKTLPDVIDVDIVKDTMDENATHFVVKTSSPEASIERISEMMRENGWDILQLHREQKNLEEIFHEIITRSKES